MTIWSYEGVSRSPEEVWYGHTCCRFCRENLELLHTEAPIRSNTRISRSSRRRVFACPICGWWKADGWQTLSTLYRGEEQSFTSTLYGAAASLRELDLTDISAPLDEVRSYLAASYDKRLTMKPKLFEITVASVFRDLGYTAVVSGCSGDGGIDVILERGQEFIGVQVKRYKNSIEVGQIRSLAGALLSKGMTHGIFVTTSIFQRGAEATKREYKRRGYKIELVDALAFYEALKLSQRNKYKSLSDFPVGNILQLLVPLDKTRIDELNNGLFFADD
jgi:restriction system protein